jgi:hypothetical protein
MLDCKQTVSNYVKPQNERFNCCQTWRTDEDRRSTTGYCCTLTEGGPLISWKSRKPPTVAISTCGAEYVALANTAQECLYLTQLLNGSIRKCIGL